MYTGKGNVLLSTGHSTVRAIQFSPSTLSKYGECDKEMFTFNRRTGQYFPIKCTSFSSEKEKNVLQGVFERNAWRSSKSYTPFLTVRTNFLTFPQWERTSAGTGQPTISL
jgi:hypothetical protein